MNLRFLMRRGGRVFFLTALAAAAVACESAGVSAQQTVELARADRALQPRMEEVFRVGKIDGADWEIFGEQPEVAFDGAGNLHVFDPMSHRVVVLNAEGRFVRQIGRRGDGPGELRRPMGFAVMRDGTVAIADMGHAAFLLFGPGGGYERSVSFRGEHGLTVLGTLLADPRGGSVLSAGRRVAMMQAQPGRSLGDMPTAQSDRSIVRFDLAAGSRHDVFTAWGPPPAQAAGGRGVARGAQAGPGMNIRPQPRAFEPGLFVAALPDGGLVVSDSTAYDLKILSPDGRVARVLRRPLQPTPVTAQMQRAERERRLAELDAGRGPQVQIATQGPGGAGGGPSQPQVREMLRRQLDELEFYPELSVVTGLRTGWTGKVWVARRASGRDVTAPGPVDVLTPAGEYVGTFAANAVRLPDALGPDGLAAWIERDRFDTPTVVVRRLSAELR